VPAENEKPPEGCTTLSLDLLRQLRERGGTLTGLELTVHADSGEWMKARVQKCDPDFKKVCATRTPSSPHPRICAPPNVKPFKCEPSRAKAQDVCICMPCRAAVQNRL
jgi:hypothetical protein